VDIDQRRAILQRAVAIEAVNGWTVITQDDTSAELLKPKRFNWPMALIAGVFTLGILFVLYAAEYALAKPQAASLSVDETGKVTRKVHRQRLVA